MTKLAQPSARVGHAKRRAPHSGALCADRDMDQFWFKTNLFDIEPNEDEETNPRIYGKQFAHWLNPSSTIYFIKLFIIN